MGKPITDAELEAIRLHHAAGLSLSGTAKLIGRAVSSTRLASVRLGLSWERSKTAAATAAAQTDMAAQRAQLAADLLQDAKRLREQMWQPAVVFAFGGRDGDYSEHRVTEPPAADKRTLMQASQAALTAHLRLVDHDSDGGVAEARSVLDGFMDAVARRASELGAVDP